MQGLAPELDGTEFVRPIDVPPFADEGMPAQPRLKANLVALPCLEPDFNERGRGECLERLVAADRILAFRISRMRFLLNERALIPDEPVAPDAGRRARMSVHD